MNTPINMIKPVEESERNRFLVYAILGDHADNTNEALRLKSSGLVEIVKFEELQLAVRLIPSSPTYHEETPDRLQEFSDVLCELHRHVDILPFRYGTIVATDELPKFLAPQKDRLLRSLAQVKGCVELNIRWAVPEESLRSKSNLDSKGTPDHTSGFNYLKSRWKSQKRDQHVESLLEDTGTIIQKSLGEECVALRTSIRTMRSVCPERDCDRSYSIAKLDLLIRRRSHHQVKQAISAIPFCDVQPTLVSGPWPAFSFIENNSIPAVKSSYCTHESKPQLLWEAKA